MLRNSRIQFQSREVLIKKAAEALYNSLEVVRREVSSILILASKWDESKRVINKKWARVEKILHEISKALDYEESQTLSVHDIARELVRIILIGEWEDIKSIDETKLEDITRTIMKACPPGLTGYSKLPCISIILIQMWMKKEFLEQYLIILRKQD
jgi:BMFP domain-containing protein YqiC